MKLIKDEDGFILRKYVGEVDNSDVVDSLSKSLRSEPIVEFKDGRMVFFTWDWIINKAIEFKNKEEQED